MELMHQELEADLTQKNPFKLRRHKSIFQVDKDLLLTNFYLDFGQFDSKHHITIHEKVSRDICINFVHKFSFEPEFSFSEIIFPRMVWKKKNFNHFGTFCLRNLYVANFYLIFLRQEFLREEKNDSRGLRSAVIYSRSIFYRT